MSHSKNQALNGEFSKEERKIAKKCIYGSPPLEIREMQSKTTLRFYFTPVRMTNNKLRLLEEMHRSGNSRGWGFSAYLGSARPWVRSPAGGGGGPKKKRKKRELLSTVDGNANWQSQYVENSQKVKAKATM
ncbi:rCG34281 [Rattus norvegicus]|uniref:RCG34281 n=1 Tax=Rattus norvegicus TaxID=10116 RepID=A6HFE6_RAT|nr:rCG34281 [Rattus norvegicus]